MEEFAIALLCLIPPNRRERLAREMARLAPGLPHRETTAREEEEWGLAAPVLAYYLWGDEGMPTLPRLQASDLSEATRAQIAGITGDTTRLTTIFFRVMWLLSSGRADAFVTLVDQMYLNADPPSMRDLMIARNRAVR